MHEHPERDVAFARGPFAVCCQVTAPWQAHDTLDAKRRLSAEIARIKPYGPEKIA